MMRGSYNLLPLGGTKNLSRALLVLLYALTFYFGPQIGGDGFLNQPEKTVTYSGGGPTGFYWMRVFNDQFGLENF